MCNRVLISLIIIVAVSVSLKAQQATTMPIINSDGTVTFVLFPKDIKKMLDNKDHDEEKDEEYDDVEVILKGTVCKKGEAEMKWDGNKYIYTTERLPSEFYTYYFEVEEEHENDPNNPNTVRDIGNIMNYFVIPEGIGDDYVDHEVGHGRIEKVWYPSDMNGMTKRRMSIYLPNSYSLNDAERYPVLYLLHGSGGDENSWEDSGRVMQILDNMIAAGRCKPMIVVMPNGNVELAAAPGEDPLKPNQKPSGMNISSMTGQIESVFMDEVVSYVDNNYRTIKDKKHRAIAGLSLGGLHTLFISLNNPDSFDYVGLFSAQTTNALNNKRIIGIQKLGEAWNELKGSIPFFGNGNIDRKISKFTSDKLSIYDDVDTKLKKQFANPPKLYYMAVGKNDFVKKLNDDWRLKLYEKGISFHYNETDGGHTWENWRKYLVDFLPRIFQDD